MRTLRQRWLWLCLFAAFSILFVGCGDDDDDDSSGAPVDDDDDDNDDQPDDDDDFVDPFDGIDVDQTFSFEGLQDEVAVIFTDHGLPHLYAKNESDLYFVFGYMTGYYRFFQMDFLRHLITGRLTEYLSVAGDDVLANDLVMRSRFMSTNGEPVFERIVDELVTPEQKAQLESFADGVNAYIADIKTGSNGIFLPDEYSGTLVGISGVTAQDIPEWTLYDTYAISRYQQWDLSHSASDEVGNGLSAAALPDDVLADTLRFAPVYDTVILPDFYSKKGVESAAQTNRGIDYIKQLDIDRLRRAFAATPEDALEGMLNQDRGSNNWVISGEHTESGNPILSNDTHLSMTNPAIFLEIHLDTALYSNDDDAFSAYGLAFPGIPGLPIGMNENIAWGATMAGYDVEDVYVEDMDDPTNPTTVQFNGADVDIEWSTQEFKIGPGDSAVIETIEIPYVPHHGPFLYGSIEASGGMTHKWTGHQPTNPLPTFTNMLKAKDVDDFMEIMKLFKVGAQNFVAIDRDGNIAYYPHTNVPIRQFGGDEVPPWLPMPGDGDYEWNGFVPSDELPHAKNPSAGYIITSNNDMVGNLLDNDPLNDEHYLYWDRLGGAIRAHRITQLIDERIDSKGAIDVEFLQSVQADTFSSEAELFLEFLSDAADANPDTVTDEDLQDVLDILEDWDFSTPIGVDAVDGTAPTQDEMDASVAATIYYLWWTRVAWMTFHDEFDDEGSVAYDAPLPARDPALYYLLLHPDDSETGQTLFDDTDEGDTLSADQIMLWALIEAVDWAESEAGFNTTDMSQWNWGKIHMTQWNDFFASFDESYAFDIKGPYPTDGAAYTVDVAGSNEFFINDEDAGDYYFISKTGPSIRMMVEASPDGMIIQNVIPGGESARFESPYYNDQAEMYLTNQTHPVPFKAQDVADNAVGRFQFSPTK